MSSAALALLLALFGRPACAAPGAGGKAGKEPAMKSGKAEKRDAPREWSGAFCAETRERAVVISEARAWTALWRKTLGAEPPEVDFSRYVAAAVFLGPRPTGGYGVRFLEPRPEEGRLLLRYREEKPSAASFVIQAFTQPYAVRLFPKTDAPASLERAP